MNTISFCSWIYSTLPKNKQVLALSATYPEYLSDHLSNYMNEPLHIRIKNETPTLIGKFSISEISIMEIKLNLIDHLILDNFIFIGIEQYYHIVPHHHLSHIVFESKVSQKNSCLVKH